MQKFKQGLELGALQIKANNFLAIFSTSNTADRTYAFPDASGTVYLSNTALSATTGTFSGYLLSASLTASGYVKAGSGFYQDAAYDVGGYALRTAAGVSRWNIYNSGTAENFVIQRYNDAGVAQGTNFSLERTTGNASFSGAVSMGALTATGTLTISTIVKTPGAIIFQQNEPGWSVNANRPWLVRSWNAPNGDYLYLGATGNTTNANKPALLLSDAGLSFGKGSDDGTSVGNRALLVDFAGNITATSGLFGTASQDATRISTSGSAGNGVSFESLNVARTGYTPFTFFGSAWNFHNGASTVASISSTGVLTATSGTFNNTQPVLKLCDGRGLDAGGIGLLGKLSFWGHYAVQENAYIASVNVTPYDSDLVFATGSYGTATEKFRITSAGSASFGNNAVSMGALTATSINGFTTNSSSSNNGPLWGSIPVIKSDGVMEIGKYLDFHESSNDGLDSSLRLYSQGGVLYGPSINVGALTANTGTFSGSIVAGNTSAPYGIYVNGIASGINGGASLLAQNAGTTIIAIGNKSAMLGGAYDATPFIYANSPISTNVSLSVGGSLTATSLSITGAWAAISLSGKTFVGSDGNSHYLYSPGANGFYFRNSADNANILRLANSGFAEFVGPVAINAAGGGQLTVGGAVNAAVNFADTNTRIAISAGNTLSFYTSNLERLKIDNNGYVSANVRIDSPNIVATTSYSLPGDGGIIQNSSGGTLFQNSDFKLEFSSNAVIFSNLSQSPLLSLDMDSGISHFYGSVEMGSTLNVTGALTASQFNGSGAGLTGTAASLTAGAASYLTTTNQGIVGGTGLRDISSPAEWSNLPIGYSAMFRQNQTATGTPSSNYGYFTKIANRDSGGGWGGIWLDYDGGSAYRGTISVGTSYATWIKFIDANNIASQSVANATNLSGGTVSATTGNFSGAVNISSGSGGGQLTVGGALGSAINFNDSGVRIAISAGNTLSFYTSNVERMKIDNNGSLIALNSVTGTQLISNIATGTAPFTVTSTTPVTNLYSYGSVHVDAGTTNTNYAIALSSSTAPNGSGGYILGKSALNFNPSTNTLSVPKISVSSSISGGAIVGGLNSVTVSSTQSVTPDPTIYSTYRFLMGNTAGIALTINNCTGIVIGQTMNFIIVQGTSVSTFNFSNTGTGSYKWANGTKNLPSTVSTTGIVSAIFDGAYWLCTSVASFAY